MAGRTSSSLLWIAALLLAAALGYFQRTTGPTYAKRGTVVVAGTELSYKLPRTHGGEGGLEVGLPAAAAAVSGHVEWRRFPSEDPWRTIDLVDNGRSLLAVIPHQPPAGKVEYRLMIQDGARQVEVPPGEAVVARFRGEVPASVLIPHILAMFGSMLLATRALFEVLRPRPTGPAALVLASMILLVLGGLLLGPIVQKYAFGAFWTGWPLGEDLTDNKTAVAVLAWLPATLLALRGSRRTRVAVVLGWVVMMGVFLVPHSLRGSQLDWSEPESASAPVEQTL